MLFHVFLRSVNVNTMGRKRFVTICHDFELHMAMINSHAHLRNKGCLRFFIDFRQNPVISDRFRQMSPNSRVNDYIAIFDLYTDIDSQGNMKLPNRAAFLVGLQIQL